MSKTTSTTKMTLGVVARHLQAIWVNRKAANQHTAPRTLPGYNGRMADMYTADRATD